MNNAEHKHIYAKENNLYMMYILLHHRKKNHVWT